MSGSASSRAEAEGIHDGERTRAHGEDVAEDAADAGGCSLIGLDVAGMVVRFDFEGAGPAVADVDDARVLAGSLHDELAARGQALEVDFGGFVGAVLAPHHGINAEFGEGGGAAEGDFDAAVFVRGDAVLRQKLRRNGGWRGRHCGGSFHGLFKIIVA